jgi:hypothetical protein
MAHHCMLKEAHTIFYIWQTSHKWIKGDEEETTYTQATENLRVVPIYIPKGFTKVQSSPWALDQSSI